MREYYKHKIKDLIALRTNLFTVIIVIIGGVLGLFFVDSLALKLIPFGVIGTYFGYIFLQNILSINKQIDIILEELKNEHY